MLPNNIYYDIQINNFESEGSSSQLLKFSETRNNNLIEDASKYKMSVLRFELDSYSLPTFVANIVVFPNTDINKMIESITLEYEGNNSIVEENLTWIPTNTHISLPHAPNPLQEESEYYYGNSYRHYCDIINNTFDNLTIALKTAVGAPLNLLLAPKMIWNDDTNKAELLAQDAFYNETVTNRVSIYFDRALYSKFTSLPAIKNYNALNNKIYRIYMKDDYTTRNYMLESELFLKTTQEYSTIANWSPISSICFLSNTLPIQENNLSEPKVYQNGRAVTTKIANNMAKIITDMSSTEYSYKPNLIYASQNNRYVDLIGASSIKDIDIYVMWKNKKGALLPFFLQSGASASIKILFELK